MLIALTPAAACVSLRARADHHRNLIAHHIQGVAGQPPSHPNSWKCDLNHQANKKRNHPATPAHQGTSCCWNSSSQSRCYPFCPVVNHSATPSFPPSKCPTMATLGIHRYTPSSGPNVDVWRSCKLELSKNEKSSTVRVGINACARNAHRLPRAHGDSQAQTC